MRNKNLFRLQCSKIYIIYFSFIFHMPNASICSFLNVHIGSMFFRRFKFQRENMSSLGSHQLARSCLDIVFQPNNVTNSFSLSMHIYYLLEINSSQIDSQFLFGWNSIIHKLHLLMTKSTFFHLDKVSICHE